MISTDIPNLNQKFEPVTLRTSVCSFCYP